MQDLTLVGLSKDGTKLLLVSDAGEEFALPADTKLRAALRGDHARLGQLEIQMESALRPRDIQTRIRAGESPEKVAAAAQTSVEKIMGFAGPVLAERAHIAERAQRSSVRRKGGEGQSRILGDAVADRLRERNISPESVEWDAWRREDGRWTLVADYRSGESPRHAEFLFDAPGRYVMAEDEEAKWLVGEQSGHRGPQPRTGSGQRRLTSVASADDELPLGSDAIDMVTDGAEEDHEPTADLSTVARSARESHRHPEVDPTSVAGDADWMATQATERPVRPQPAKDVPDETDDASDPAEPATASDEADTPDAEEGSETTETSPPRAPRKAVRKNRGRASVPSWDEIMFGGGGGRAD
ncbi:MAG TPA: septation protein SepH [Nocardioidaceae bacterium]|jgi:hypothetical protein|nr:septation protein SepH [Nocardioidaceae bacterium]